jgi:hypothetical protein
VGGEKRRCVDEVHGAVDRRSEEARGANATFIVRCVWLTVNAKTSLHESTWQTLIHTI